MLIFDIFFFLFFEKNLKSSHKAAVHSDTHPRSTENLTGNKKKKKLLMIKFIFL